MAALTGLDEKTVHRAYARLVAEGLLVARAGSGTFVAPDGAAGPDPARLVTAAERIRREAGELGLDPGTYARFLGRMAGPGLLADLSLAVVECNGEQRGLIAREVRHSLGATVHTVALRDLALCAGTLVTSVRAVVTTDCHRDEVQHAVGPLGLPVFRVALDPGHAENLLRHARRATVVMVVRDIRYAPALRRLLAQLATPEDVGRRIRVIEPRELPRTLREVDPPGALHVSPLLGPAPAPPLPRGWRRVAPHAYLDVGALDVLRAQLALLEARAAVVPRTSAQTSRGAAALLGT